MSTITTTADKIVRRRVAVEFLGKGMTMADVALVLGVSLSSVKRWKKAHRQGGDEALLPKPQLGPESKLDASQRERLQELLLAGPLAAGFSTELWTCRRVAEVVRREFGVDYHPDHAWPPNGIRGSERADDYAAIVQDRDGGRSCPGSTPVR
jgi:transposase